VGPRAQDEKADATTNEGLGGVIPERRGPIDSTKIELAVLKGLVEAGLAPPPFSFKEAEALEASSDLPSPAK
jgi:hypothetical protein